MSKKFALCINDSFLSTFYHYPIKINGQHWETIEHYYQASKFYNTHYANIIKSSDSANKAYMLGTQQQYANSSKFVKVNSRHILPINQVIEKNKHIPIYKNWESQRLFIMTNANMHKFKDNDTFKKGLINTGETTLIYKTNNDDFWGVNNSDKGCNMLGHILMDIRAIFKADSLSK